MALGRVAGTRAPEERRVCQKGLRTENQVSAAPTNPAKAKSEKSEPIWILLPHIWMLIRPRRWLLALGFGLMAINRVAGLVLPASPKYLIDDIIGRRQSQFLLPLIGAVAAATAVQGVTSYALTQLLSKAAQRMIADLRRQVQA